jgi:hypothetical protein
MKFFLIISAVVALSLLNGCLGTLALSQNIRTDVLSNFDQKGNISATYDQIVNAPDTLKLISLATDGGVYGYSGYQYLHNIKPAFQSMLTEYMSTKFNTMKKTDNQINILVTLSDYKISSRDISAKGEKFLAVMGASADLRSEYSAELKCHVKIEYKGESYEKNLSVKENDQDLTQLRTSSVSSYNAYSGYSRSNYSTSSSSNPVEEGIGNCLNNAHTRILINIDKMINDILIDTKSADKPAIGSDISPTTLLQPEERSSQENAVKSTTEEGKNISQ